MTNKYVDKLLTCTDKLKDILYKEAKGNIIAFSEYLKDNPNGVQINICTIVSEYSGCRISEGVLDLLEIPYEEDDAIETLEWEEPSLNRELDTLLEDFPEIEGYNIYHYFGFLENNGYCLIQSITEEDGE